MDYNRFFYQLKSMKVGWCELASLPELGIDQIKVKIDTGAKTSSLHINSSEVLIKDGEEFIKFHCESDSLPPRPIVFESKIIDQRQVKSSSGTSQLRYVIETDIVIGKKRWPIQVTLTNRKKMKFKMLLGREAMKKITVKPRKKYLQNKVNEENSK